MYNYNPITASHSRYAHSITITGPFTTTYSQHHCRSYHHPTLLTFTITSLKLCSTPSLTPNVPSLHGHLTPHITHPASPSYCFTNSNSFLTLIILIHSHPYQFRTIYLPFSTFLCYKPITTDQPISASPSSLQVYETLLTPFFQSMPISSLLPLNASRPSTRSLHTSTLRNRGGSQCSVASCLPRVYRRAL